MVSVLIPTHNRAALLGRAIASVLGQTVGDFEIVIADDASSDGTRDMVLSIGDRRIKYVRHEENRGAASARNTAIANATGEYVAFLDDDDEWLPEKLRIQLDRMEIVGRNVGAICCGHYEVDRPSNRILAEITPSLRGRIFEKLLTQGFFNPTSTILARAKCFDTVGVFDPALRYVEDFDMWLRLAKEYEFDFVARPLVRLYREPSGHLSQDYPAVVSGTEMHLSKHREFFEQNPSVYSNRLYTLGTYYCFIGDLQKGREMFRRAVGLDPTFVKSYVGLALSLGGSGGFKACYAAKNRLVELFAKVHEI